MEKQNNAECSLRALDPRMKLFMVVFLTTVTYISENLFLLTWNYALIICLYLFSSLWKNAGKTAILLGSFVLMEGILRLLPVTGITTALLFLTFIIGRTIIFFVMSNWMGLTIKITDLITAFQNMHAPKGLTITLAVVFRYLPTVSEEFAAIQKTMRLRNIELSVSNVIRHPVRMCEYAIVPLVIRSMKIADELSASAMTRGLDLEGKRTSYKEIRLRFSDVLIVLILAALVAAGMYLDFLVQKG